jgi:hypothetical protein
VIVIFEGPDGAGKSTMIEAVKQIHLDEGHASESVQIWRAGPFPPDSDPWREYVFPLTSLYPSRDWLVLIDRWHLGELVYGPIFRGQSRLSLDQRTWIEGYLKTMGAVMIHLTARQEELIRRLDARGDDMVKAEHIPEILAGYAKYTGDGHQPRIFCRTHDTTGQRTQPTAASIYQLAKLEIGMALSAEKHPSHDDQPYWERHPWPS